jgi:hypothetical protein
MKMIRIASTAFAVVVVAASMAWAGAPELHGKLQLPITTITDKLKPFDITINGKPRNTGTVQLTLDPEGARSPTITFDFDSQQVEIDTDLVINAPLLKRMNSPKTTVSVTETASFEIVKSTQKDNVVTMTVNYVTDSNGIIDGGPADGAQYRNRKDPCPRYPPQSGRISVTVDNGGNVTGGEALTPSALLCSADSGTLTFEDQQLTFNGSRKGIVGK